ncbi:MAG TPA: hypothetical protein VEY69_16605, partial [Lautropia sp.]|nr:hypothetical protein [Lautropia sp.]
MPLTLPEAIRSWFGLPLTGIDAATAGKGETVFQAGRVRWVREVARDEAPAAVKGSSTDRTDSTDTAHGTEAMDSAGELLPGRFPHAPTLTLESTGNAQRSWALEGAVAGSHGESYLTRLTLRRHGAVIRATSDCTCPVTVQCKHAAALLFAWLQDGDSGEPVAKQSASGSPTVDTATEESSLAQRRSRALFQRQHALQWARELNTVKVENGEDVRASLCYVLQVQERSARLSVYRMRRLKNDEFSRPDRYPAFVDQALNPPAFWDDVDASVALSMLQQERSSTFGHALTGPRAGDSLLLLTQAGRLFLDEPPQQGDDQALKAGPRMAARVAWQVQAASGLEDDGPLLRLGLEILPASGAAAIYCTPPFYLDRTGGLLGPLDLEEPVSASMMRWLRNAPPVPPGAAAEVALALHTSGLSRPALRGLVPPLPRQEVREVKGAPRFVLGLFTTNAAAPRHRQRGGTGSRSFMAISMAVEYAGVRIEPLRRATLAVQTAEGPRLVVCDPVAERTAWTMLREALAGIAPDEAA